MKKIAIVLDTSASMGNSVEVFTLDYVGWVEKLRELLTQFEEIYFFTDGLLPPSWEIILNSRIRVVKVS